VHAASKKVRKSSAGHKKSDVGQTMGDFFAPRQRNGSKQPCEDENTSLEQSIDDEPPVKTKNVRRSSRLSAQAAAAAIARVVQVN